MKRLEDFWFRVRVSIWENFTWKDFDHKETGNAQKIVDEVNNVRTVLIRLTVD